MAEVMVVFMGKAPIGRALVCALTQLSSIGISVRIGDFAPFMVQSRVQPNGAASSRARPNVCPGNRLIALKLALPCP